MFLAIGGFVDLQQNPGSPQSEVYYHLARASMCEHPILEDVTYDSVLMMVRCHELAVSGLGLIRR